MSSSPAFNYQSLTYEDLIREERKLKLQLKRKQRRMTAIEIKPTKNVPTMEEDTTGRVTVQEVEFAFYGL